MRSAEEIRADLALADASETWSDRYHDAIVRLLHDVEPLLAAVKAVESLHEPVDWLAGRRGESVCLHDSQPWPCATVRALTAAAQ